jgi:hypothetical protein
MLLNSIQDLPAAPERAVIINVGTKWVSTLALLSALRHVGMPVLLIDCEYGDGSLEHFKGLLRDHEFDLLSAPLKKHGATLDWLFRNIPAETVLLLDSDVEILDEEIVRLSRNLLRTEPGDEPEAFGSGFVHGPCWLHDHPGVGYYQERMWIPFSFLRTARVREALGTGLSFLDRAIPNDLPFWPLASRILGLRFHLGMLRNTRLSWLNPLKRTFYGHKPSYVFCDTGADVFQYLKYERGLSFAGFPAGMHRRFVTHFHGTTRQKLDPEDTNTLQNVGMHEVRERLLVGYGMEMK